MSDYPEREYGMGKPDSMLTGIPVVKERMPLDQGGKCPNCGCETVFMIQVPMKHPLVQGTSQVGSYVGCPACPWASPMMITAAPEPAKP